MKRLSYGVDERPMLPLTTFRKIYQGLIVYLNRSPIERKMDVAITARHRQSKSEKDEVEEKSNTSISNWAEILVIGKLKSNIVLDGRILTWLNLVTYAREVFRVQGRRFVSGFTLYGFMMRLW